METTTGNHTVHYADINKSWRAWAPQIHLDHSSFMYGLGNIVEEGVKR